MKIAILLTCHNRITKTKKCIHNLEVALNAFQINDYQIYLTDDGSTDGTGEWVVQNTKNATVLYSDGTLFWAKGMYNSWKEALKNDYDYYLLLNDDTELVEDSFKILFDTIEYSKNKFSKQGLAIGGTKGHNDELSYSGALIVNKFLYTQKRLTPNGEYQSAEIANANIMLVPKEVVTSIGIINNKYAHGMADYDYSYNAHINNFPVIICPEYCGICDYDHDNPYNKFKQLNLKGRIKMLKNPLGLDFISHFTFLKRFFPYRAPFVFGFAWFKVLLPNVYYGLLKLRGWK